MSASSIPVVRIKRRRALPFFSGHPWVFAGAIDRIDGDPPPGSEVLLQTHDGEFIARGLFNPHSNIRVRLYSRDADRPLDHDLWEQRLDSALALREQLFGGRPESRACRLVFSEADGLSGLTVDRYGEHLLLQWTSGALADREAEFVELLQQRLRPAGLWRRTEKGIGEAEGLETCDGLICGTPPPRPLFIEENQVRYGVDVTEGHKTGFYFDQRDNRLAAARYLRGRVLDLFCYTGGFGLNALRHGAVDRVLAVDSSESALELARRNAELNELASQIDFERAAVADKLQQLQAAGERFDGVILDPPRMARTRGGLQRALRGYFNFNRAAVDLLNPGGILVTCSCSGLVSRDGFQQVIVKVATDSGRRIQILESRGQAADHPVSVQCLENAYLKCLICRIE